MDERNEKDDALKEYGNAEACRPNASQPEGGQTDDAGKCDSDAPPQDSGNPDAGAPLQYSENPDAQGTSDYRKDSAVPWDAAGDSGSGTLSGHENQNPVPETPVGPGESDFGLVEPVGPEEPNPGPETPPEYGEQNPGSETPVGPGEPSYGPGEPSGYGEQNPGSGPPPGYGEQNPVPETPVGPGEPNYGPGEPSGYGEQNPGSGPPPGYEGNNWQNGAAGAPHGYGPGAPPPGYEKNNWQGTPPPPPGYGYGRPHPGGYGPYNGPRKSNNMALASLFLGIMSIVLCCCGGFGIILGAVGIVLAILSRGSEPMETSAKVGLGLSIGGIVLGIVVLVMSFVVAGSDQFRNDLNRGGYGNYESYRHYLEHGGL